MLENKFQFLVVLGILGIVAISGCTSNMMGATNPNLGPDAIAIQNSAFNPSLLHVQMGTTVTWSNLDSTAHHVVSDTGAFDSGVLNEGQSYSFTFTQPGTYQYHDAAQLTMRGSIVVTSLTPSNALIGNPSTSNSTSSPSNSGSSGGSMGIYGGSSGSSGSSSNSGSSGSSGATGY